MTYLNASEHIYGFDLREAVFLRNSARRLGYQFSSQIGGCESVRDLQQARLLSVDALECSFVESVFAFQKLSNAILSVFDQSEPETIPLVFLLVETIQALDSIEEILSINHSSDLPLKVFPIFDRRAFARSSFSLDSEKFSLDSYEDHLNRSILKLSLLTNGAYGISGGLSITSISRLFSNGFTPMFFKLGLTTIQINSFSSDVEKLRTIVLDLQHKEALLLNSLRSSLNHRFQYISDRQHHLMNYLFEASVL